MPISSDNLYEILDIETGATEKEISLAYRKLTKIHHPDVGGKREDFDKISLAYRILSNVETKNVYDNTGHIADQANNIKVQAMVIIKELLGQLFLHDHILKIDLVEKMKELSNNKINDLENNIEITEKAIVKIEKALLRFNKSNIDDDPIRSILTKQINEFSKQKIKIDYSISIMNTVLDILEDYKFDPEPIPPLDERTVVRTYDVWGGTTI